MLKKSAYNLVSDWVSSVAGRRVNRPIFKTLLYLGLVAAILGYACLFGYARRASAQASLSDVPQTLSAGDIHLPPEPVKSEPAVLGGALDVPRQQTFVISAYYSPLPGQTRYVTGSYAGDVRLNGDGVKAADGTHVYPGMIAAPKSYAFGTKMKIPGIGTVAVHDRGGAIVHSGERGNSYDRLDVWMGYGDAGLKRALQWGKRTVEVTVYGIDPNIKEEVYLAGYSESERYAVTNTLTPGDGAPSVQTAPQAGTVVLASADKINASSAHAEEDPFKATNLFERDLRQGDSGEDVRKLQEELKRINLLGIEPTGYYGEITAHAVFKFQQTQLLAGDKNSLGAGIFGPKTRAVLNGLVAERERTEQLIAARKPEESA